MSKLEQDTRLSGGDGILTANLHEDWQVWFPNGGYMAAMLLRAVGETSNFERPISHSCYFLSVPKPGPVDIKINLVRRTRNAEAFSFLMSQNERPIIQGMSWTGQEVEGYSHDDIPMPSVPDKHALLPTKRIKGAYAPHSFWSNFEQRPVDGKVHWLLDAPETALQRDWLSFHGEVDTNPYVNAGRLVVLLDSFGWPAAARAHTGDSQYIAPTLSLSINFHRQYNEQWMLSEAKSPVAAGGYTHVENRLWSEQGSILATGQAMLMCRPRPK